MTMQNDATGKQPTVAEEMAKFQSVGFKDGEVSAYTNKDGAADQEAQEARAQLVNGRTHAENVAAGAAGADGKDGQGDNKDGKAAVVELTDEEKSAAITAAEKTEGAELTDEEKEAVLATALASKQRTAAVAARKAAKAARYSDNHRTAKAAERRANAAEARLATLEAELAALRSGKPLTGDKAGSNNAADDTPPDPTDTEKYQYGELDPKYLKDLSRHEAKAAIREGQEKALTDSKAKADQEAQEAFKERVATFTEAGEDEFEDFHETVMESLASKENPDGWPCSATLGELLMESEHGPAIAYALATDIAEARRVFKLPEPRQAIWFGKKEAELDTAGSAANGQGDGKAPAAAAGGKTQIKANLRESKAPPPPSKLPGGSGNKMPSAATTDFAAFESLAMAPKR